MQKRSLEGKTAWITGSSRGIGQAIAVQLARSGADVVIHGSSMNSSAYFGEGDSLAEVAGRIAKDSGVRTMYVSGDLTKPENVQDMVRQIRGQFTRIDILVNNAGGDIGSKGVSGPNAGKITEGNDAVFLPYEDIRAIIDRNLWTCISVCKEVVPEMIERKSGRVVNIGSVAGTYGRKHGAIYCAAKAAVHNYTRCLADLLRPYGITANVVAPGDTLSPRFKASRPIDSERLNSYGSLVRYAWPAEIAAAVEFLVSEASAHITGQILRVDGGSHLWPA